MTKVISSFSNTTGDLQSLDDEYVGLVRFFSKPEIKSRVDFEPHLNEDLDTLTSTILDAKKEMRLFHFSGHSRQSGLDFPEAEFDARHVVRFFNTLNQEENNLQCMFINGCENAEIIRKLKKVPVVIGTKSKIQDSVAQKFTQDFFSSLISGKSSYRQAFLDALAAQRSPDYKVFEPLRGEGAADQLTGDEELNQYYMVVNDDEVANQKFPFRKGPANFAKYIFIMLILLALIFGILFRDQLLGMVRGYTCPDWDDDSKCRMLVADFNYSGNFPDINELIAEEIKDNEEVNPYIEAKHTAEFKDYLKRESGREELHKLCGYEFSLTGDVVDTDGGKYKMELDLFTDYPDFRDEESETIEIGSTDELKQMVQTVGPQNSDHFLLNRLCIACAQKREELIPVIEKSMKEYKKTMASAESYQNLNMEMFALHKRRGDQEKMLTVLSNIADVGNNDYVLGALERTVRLNKDLEMVPEAFRNQSRYIDETEMRLENPAAFKMNFPEDAYVRNQLKMRLNRGNYVLAHPEELRDHLRAALTDFRMLQEANFRGGDYREQIRKILELLEGGSVTPAPEMQELTGLVRDQNGRPIAGVQIRYEGGQVASGADGRFYLEFPETDQLTGKTIILRKEGFHPVRFRIRDVEELKDVRMERQEEVPETRLYTFKGEVRDCDHKGTVLEEIYIDGVSVPLSNSGYMRRIEATPGTTVQISLPGGFHFQGEESIQVVLGDEPGFDRTLHVYSEPARYSLYGKVVGNGVGVPGAAVQLAGTNTATRTRRTGDFVLSAEVDICSELEISAQGYDAATLLIKEHLGQGPRVDIGEVELKKLAPQPDPDTEVKPEIVLQTLNVQGDDYKSLLTGLRRAGYAVSDKSSMYDKKPPGFPDKNTVLYMDDAYADDAKKVARAMYKLANVEFDIRKWKPSTIELERLKALRRARDLQTGRNRIYVQYMIPYIK